jgi:hypothetical protein
MGKSLQQILGAPVLTGLIQSVKPGLPNPLPPQLMTIVDKTVPTNFGQYTVVKSTRKVARLVQYGSPSVRSQLQDVSVKNVTLMNSAENIQLKQTDFMALRNYDDPNVQELGAKEVARQVTEFKSRFENLRVSAVASIFSKGKIWFNKDGELLNSSSGAFTTIDYEVPTENTGTLDSILTDWSTASTDIIGQIAAVKKKALQETGYPIAAVIYGENIADYIANNNAIRNFVRGSDATASAFYASGVIPNKLAGLDWIPGYDMFYEKPDGTKAEWFDPDGVTFIPAVEASWWGWLYGTTPIPRNIGGVNINATNPNQDTMLAPGMYSYGTVTHDPMTANIYAGDVSLPVLKVPASIFIGHTTN